MLTEQFTSTESYLSCGDLERRQIRKRFSRQMRDHSLPVSSQAIWCHRNSK